MIDRAFGKSSMTCPDRVHCSDFSSSSLTAIDSCRAGNPFEMIQKCDRRLLIFRRELMIVISLRHPDPIRMIELAVHSSHFANGFVRALDRKEIDTPLRQIQDAGTSLATTQADPHDSKPCRPDLAPVAVRIFENPVVHPHRQ